MKPSHACTTCGRPVTTAYLNAETITIDARPDPTGNLITDGRHDSKPRLQRPQHINRTEAFRYRQHQCPPNRPRQQP